jgi:hypothetical protein
MEHIQILGRARSSIQFWMLISTVPLRPRDLENRGISTGEYKDHASYLRQLKRYLGTK